MEKNGKMNGRAGKISYAALQRSVRKQMKSGGGLLPGFAQYRDMAFLPDIAGEGGLASAVISGTAESEDIVRLLFYRGLNQLAAQYITDSISVSAAFVLPEGADEEQLAARTAFLAGLCQKEEAAFAQVFATASAGVSETVLTLTFTGRRMTADKNAMLQQGGALMYTPKAGDALVAVGHTGMAGSGFAAREKARELYTRYAAGFVDQAAAFVEKLSVRDAVRAFCKSKDFGDCLPYLFPVQEGGVFAALWYLADGLGLGFDIHLKQLPIRQETVEICEYFRINPYQLAGDGMLLAAARDAKHLLAAAKSCGLEAVVFGYMTGDKGKRILNDEEVRYLDKPAPDELERLRQASV